MKGNWIASILAKSRPLDYAAEFVDSSFGFSVATANTPGWQAQADFPQRRLANTAVATWPIDFFSGDAKTYCRLGFAAKEGGRPEEAERCFRRALAIDPCSADAHYMLGSLALDSGNDSDTCLHFRKALETAPDNEYASRDFCQYLFQQGRVDEAAQVASQAIVHNPDSALMHFYLGNINVSQHERRYFKDAVANYRRALKIFPDFAEAHYNLGNALLALGRHEEAAASYRRVIEINPNFAEAHYNLGNALIASSDIDEAVRSYLRALDINHSLIEAQVNLGIVLAKHGCSSSAPFFRTLKCNPKVSEAIVSLADLRTDEGNFSEARQLYRCAMLIDPESATACAGFSRTRKMTVSDDAWLTQALCLIESKLPPQKEAPVRFALGKYYDDTGAFAQSFHHIRIANELMKQSGPGYVGRIQTQVVDTLIRSCDRDWVRQNRTTVQDSTRPVFIVGMPRSGTSLAEQILASHPSVFGAGELPFWHAAAGSLEPLLANGRDCRPALAKIGSDYLALLDSLCPDALHTVNKLPGNFLLLGLIHATFPQARIIHMQRNPLDTCFSLYFQDFGEKMPYSHDLADLAHFYREYARIMAHWNTTLPQETILHVRYEDLVGDQRTWSRKMLEFIGMPWDPRCLDFHSSVRQVKTASNWQVRQPIYTTSVERWRNYAKFIGPLLALQDLAPLGTQQKPRHSPALVAPV